MRDLAGERVALTLLTPEPEFVYRPMTVREPFAYGAAHHYPLEQITHEVGAELIQDAFAGWMRTPASRTPRRAPSSPTTRWCSRSGRARVPASSTR